MTYQACITHYRRQHCLGRYQLAVDTALAYEESARVLKGAGWKVNFRSRGEYEDARARETGVGGGAGVEGGLVGVGGGDGGAPSLSTRVGGAARPRRDGPGSQRRWGR